MFFEDHEKKVYTPTGTSFKFDPLAIDRALRVATGNRLARLVTAWKAIDSDEGDISEDGVQKKILASCEAEELLAGAARAAFGLPQFPDCTDAEALEMLCDYLDWVKKKGTRESTPPDSSTSGTATTHPATISKL